MAAAENGHAKGGGKDRANGHAVAHKSTLKSRSVPRQSWYSWSLNNITRLSIWYALITILFRCPATPKELVESSPEICEPYFTTKNFVQPYLTPYYETYAAPYINKVQPFYTQADVHVFTPASKFLVQNYHKYAAPQVNKAKWYGKSQWDAAVLPQVQVAQSRAAALYSTNVAPHVSQASSVVSPYYETARDTAATVHQEHVLPAIEQTKPHLQTAYATTEKFVLETALPATQYAWTNLVIFIDGTLWPFVKTIYRDNVRPQLVMISERIAKYQEGRKLQAVIDEVDASSSAASTVDGLRDPSATTASPTDVADTISSFMASIVEDATSMVEEVSSSVVPQETRQPQYATDESVTEDLVKWQKKFAVAADKGTDDLKVRVEHIIAGLVSSDLDVEGTALTTALEKAAKVEVEKLKAKIQSVAGSLADEASDADVSAAEEEVALAVRAAGGKLRERALSVRSWSQTFQTAVSERVLLAAESTLQVLDNIRDLGLQEIGMRWAWMEGVTYNHWQKYHDLKQRFDEWRNEVRDVAVYHPAAIEAQESAEALLEKGMAVTEDAAKELIRLKNVAGWKIRARDTTDNFEDRIIPAAAVSAASKLASGVQDITSSLAGTTQGTVDSVVSHASRAAESLSSAASSAVTDQAGRAQAMVDKASSYVSDASASLSSAAVGTNTDPAQPLVSDLSSAIVAASVGAVNGAGEVDTAASAVVSSMSAASSVVLSDPSSSIVSAASQAYSSASSAVVGNTQGTVDSVVSDASSGISSIVLGTTPGVIEQASASVSSVASDASRSAGSAASAASGSASSMVQSARAEQNAKGASKSASSVVEKVKDTVAPAAHAGAATVSSGARAVASSASAAASSASAKVFAGAMAQEVKGQMPIYDDVFDDDSRSSFSSQVQSIVSEAGEGYAEVTKAISEALYGTSAGVVESATSLAANQYIAALSAASSALYGTPTPIAESVASVASDRYRQAVAAASSAIYGTQYTGVEAVWEQAKSAYDEATSKAAEYQSAAADVVSKQISGTPQPIHSQMLASITAAYSAALRTASAELDEATRAVSGQYSSLSSAASAAIPTQNSVESISSVASSRLQGALAAASSQYLNVKVAVGATPTPALMQAQQNYYAAVGYAHEQYSSFITAGSSALYGTPTPAYQKYVDQASSKFAEASLAASSSLDAYLSSISSIASKATKTKSPAQSLLDQASSSYSSALSAASETFSSASEQASIAVLGTQAPAYQRALASVSAQYAAATAVALANMNELLSAATSAVGKKSRTPAQSVLDTIQSQYDVAVSAASSSLSAASASASSVFYGPSVGRFESVSSVASTNWAELVAQASRNIYGQPTPVWASITSQAGEYTAQATDAAAAQFVIVQSYVSELVVGKEPDFTESVMSRLSSVYFTGVAASASSLASEAYESGSSIYSSVSSAAAGLFTPPPEVNSILDQVNSQINAVIDAASGQVYGTSAGTVEKAQSAAAEAYASVSSAASEAVYGTQPSYGEAAQESIALAASSASEAISVAIFGTPTGQVESAASAAASAYASASAVVASSLSAAGESVGVVGDAARARVSDAIFGPQQGALESAQSRILEAVESARSRVAELGSQAGTDAQSVASQVSKSVESVASVVSETVSSATQRAKDEL